MSFRDLPEDWPSRPLTDPTLVDDVLDLLVSERDRQDGALFILLCDSQDHLALPTACDDPPALASAVDREFAVRTVLRGGEPVLADGSFLVAFARRGSLEITADDTAWARAAAAAARHSPLRLLGVHVVTSIGSREIPRDAA